MSPNLISHFRFGQTWSEIKTPSWRTFASTHPLMLPCTLPKEILFAFPPSPPWNLPFFTVESTFSSPCSRSDSPTYRQGAALAHLDPLTPCDLVLWTDGPFFFLLAKAALAYFPAALFVALRAHFPFRQARYAKVFPLKPAQFCKLFADVSSTNKSAISLLFSSFLTFALSSPSYPLLYLSFYLNLSSKSGRNCLLFPPCIIRLLWVPRHSFLPNNDAADGLARRGVLLMSSATPCSLSSLIFRIYVSLHFSDWRRAVLSKFFDIQVPSISIQKLGLSRYVRCALSRLLCNGNSLLLSSCLSRMGRIKNFSCSASGHLSQDTSHLILHCPATN